MSQSLFWFLYRNTMLSQNRSGNNASSFLIRCVQYRINWFLSFSATSFYQCLKPVSNCSLTSLVMPCYIWQLWVINPGNMPKKAPTATYQSSLSYHGSAVNVLRFSPSGECSCMFFKLFSFVLERFHTMRTAG